MLPRLVAHLLANHEVVELRTDGTWSHNNDRYVSFLGYAREWTTRFGHAHDPNPIFLLESTLTLLGPGSRAEFTPVEVPSTPSGTLRAVKLEICDGENRVRSKSNIFYADEVPEWFSIALRMSCSMALDQLQQREKL